MSLPVIPGNAQENRNSRPGENGWDRTRRILECAPRLVDRSDLVEDNFEHRYVTSNPRDIEVGYFSVEPVTYHEQGRRFCEALLPAAGVSQTHFRGTYVTTYTLPGEGVYAVSFTSMAHIFNDEIRIINAQNTVAEIEAAHWLELEVDTSMNHFREGTGKTTGKAYTWELEIDASGSWEGELSAGDFEVSDHLIPAGFSTRNVTRWIRGPGVVTVRESVIFKMSTISPYKYDPIFQAACMFSLEPLSVSAKLLPCED